MSAKKRSAKEQAWRDVAAAALEAAGHEAEALAFKYCGDEAASYTLACSADPLHFSKVVPKTCKCRYCAECEGRAQFLRLRKYMPAIQHALDTGPKDYRLRHIVLTTPIPLTADNAREKYQCYWKFVNQALNRVAWRELKKQGRLTEAEIRRGRIDYKKHGMGFLIGAEFGEKSHHLHYHVLWWGCWIARNWLTEEYRRYTGDESYVTSITAVREAADGANEVLAKYATKLTELPPALVPKLRDVLLGTRRVRSYGVFFALPKEEKEPYCCEVCSAKLVIWPTDVFEATKPQIEAARRERSLLNLIQAHKSGETANSPPTAVQLALPDIPPERVNPLKYFDAME